MTESSLGRPAIIGDNSSQDTDSLCGNLLLAVPSLADPFFSQTVTYICEHNAQGAMGLVINQPTEVKLQEVFEQLQLGGLSSAAGERAIGYGGPVSRDRGFILHTSIDEQDRWSSSIEISHGVSVTTSTDIIEALAKDQGPEKWLFLLGYAGWGAGQLEEELAGNSWITTEANTELIFDTPADRLLKLAASQLGIDINLLGSAAGSA